MQRTIEKKVRLTPGEAQTLRRLARARKTTESEVLREALRKDALVEKHRKNIKKLIAMADAENEEWERPDYEVRW